MKRKNDLYPSKVTLNLAMREKSPFSPLKLIPLLVLLLAAAALFSKFAVADRLAAVQRVQADLNALQQHKAELEESTAGYDELLEEYNRYSISWMTEEESQLVLRGDLLALIEEELMPKSQVRSISISGNVISVELGGITLDDTAHLVQRLYQLPSVSNVAVYTASTKTESGDQASVFMVITTTQSEEGGQGS